MDLPFFLKKSPYTYTINRLKENYAPAKNQERAEDDFLASFFCSLSFSKTYERFMINAGEILLYTGKDGEVKVDVLYGNQNIWLTQKKMALLFGVQIPAINKHLKNIFESEELKEDSVISILETTAADGKSYPTMIINYRRAQ